MMTSSYLEVSPHSYNVTVEWETGETSYEPLSLIAKDGPITAYAKKNGLCDPPGWKFLK